MVSTAMSLLGLYRDPIIAASRAARTGALPTCSVPSVRCRSTSCVPPSDISRTRPLVRLILNQIGRRLTETLTADPPIRTPASCS